jgi:NTE family protein
LISGYDDFLSDADVAAVASYPSDLNALSAEAFDRIARHGYEVADYTLTTYSPQHFTSSNHVRLAGST